MRKPRIGPKTKHPGLQASVELEWISTTMRKAEEGYGRKRLVRQQVFVRRSFDI
jgi:hypothetical protein